MCFTPHSSCFNSILPVIKKLLNWSTQISDSCALPMTSSLWLIPWYLNNIWKLLIVSRSNNEIKYLYHLCRWNLYSSGLMNFLFKEDNIWEWSTIKLHCSRRVIVHLVELLILAYCKIMKSNVEVNLLMFLKLENVIIC